MELQANIFRVFISLWYLPLVKISIKSMSKGCHDPEVLYGLTLNYPIKNMNFTDTNYHRKNQVDWIFDTQWEKISQPQKWKFWEKGPKKLKNITILHFMTTFHNVALKIETSFKLQRCLKQLWKLERSMIDVKT